MAHFLFSFTDQRHRVIKNHMVDPSAKTSGATAPTLSPSPPLSIPHMFINQALLQAKSPIVRDSCRFVNDCKIHGKIRHKCLRKYIYLGYCKVMKVNFTVLK